MQDKREHRPSRPQEARVHALHSPETSLPLAVPLTALQLEQNAAHEKQIKHASFGEVEDAGDNEPLKGNHL